MKIDLNNAFPEPEKEGVERGPLPKQKEFLELALKPNSPKYVRYTGGIGSGKSLVGCVNILTLALMYPGDFLVSRLFMPELRSTTYKTFKEAIRNSGADQLVIADKVADAEIILKANGGVSTIMFRGLEEPEKLRSLNLNAFYIDEAQQVSEAAFTLLQGRLRGRHVRKGFLTQNSGGHDWTWRWFVKKDLFKNESIKKEFYNIKAPSTENVHLPEGYVDSMLQSWSDDRIQREIFADEDSFSGQVYSEFRADVHVIKPFAIPKEWTRFVGADHGYRNPAAWVWGAMDYDQNVYIYREFYQKEWLIEEICKGKSYPGGAKSPGVVDLSKDSTGQLEDLQFIKIDPSTKARRGTNGLSDWDAYLEHLPSTWPLQPANNQKQAGIDRLKSYLKIDLVTKKPKLFFFDTCVNTIDELVRYRYDELTTAQQGNRNEKEEPKKVNDHAADACRYLIMGLPEPPKAEDNVWDRVKYNSLEGSMLREMEQIKSKTGQKDPFQGF